MDADWTAYCRKLASDPTFYADTLAIGAVVGMLELDLDVFVLQGKDEANLALACESFAVPDECKTRNLSDLSNYLQLILDSCILFKRWV